MARRQQLDVIRSSTVAARTPSSSPASRARASQKSNVASASSVSAERVGVAADERRQLVEDALLLGLDRQLRLAPGVAQLDHDQRLDEQRLAAARLVVDDALDLALGIGADRHDVAAVAQRDERLLERRPTSRCGGRAVSSRVRSRS